MRGPTPVKDGALPLPPGKYCTGTDKHKGLVENCPPANANANANEAPFEFESPASASSETDALRLPPSPPPPLPPLAAESSPPESEPRCQNPNLSPGLSLLIALSCEAAPVPPLSKKKKARAGCDGSTPLRPPTRKKPRTGKKTPDQGIDMETLQVDGNEGGEDVGERAETETETAPPEIGTKDANARNMIPVNVYAGGEIHFNQMGALYSIPPMYTFFGTQQTTFKDVTSEIYSCLKVSRDQLISLNIQARYNAVPTGPFFFALLAINDDKSWRMVYEMAASGMSLRIVELYVKSVPNIGMIPQNANLNPNPTMSVNYPFQSGFSKPQQMPNRAHLFPANHTYKSKKHLWNDIAGFHIKANIEIAVTSTSKSELVVSCKDPRCHWKLHANATTTTAMGVRSSWKIKTCLYPHTCQTPLSELNLPEITFEVIAEELRKEIQQDSELKIVKLRELVLKKFPGTHASYKNLWHARERAIAELFGGWEESYAILPRLFEAIKASNPDTKFDLQSDNITQFKRVAWAFGPCINAYRFIRPVISVKSLLLLGKYDGRLLIACGYDTDNEPVPLAFALVNEDTESNWIWFMKFIRTVVIGRGWLVCLISDYDGRINNIFEHPSDGWCEAKQEAVHRLCSKNVAGRVSKVCKDIEVMDLFHSAAHKTHPRKFEKEWGGIKGKYHPYEKSTTTTDKWAQCEDRGFRYGIMTSNCSETVKRVFKSCWRLPVAGIVENTFSNCMRWFSERKQRAAEQAAAGKVWPDTITEILQKRGDKAEKYEARAIPPYSICDDKKGYEVVIERMRDTGLKFLKYNVSYFSGRFTPECECRKLKLTGIPCSHVIAVCRKRKVDPMKFVDPYYRLEMLVKTWSAEFYMYGNESEWPEYNGAVIVPDKTLLRTGPRKPENSKDNNNGESSGKKHNPASECGC